MAKAGNTLVEGEPDHKNQGKSAEDEILIKIIRDPMLYKEPKDFFEYWVGEKRKSLGNSIVFLFPTQDLLEFWEGQLLSILGSWGGARFLLFDGLVREIIDETRPEATDVSSGTGSLILRMLAEELTSQGKIRYLSQAIDSPGLYPSIMEELSLLKRGGIDSQLFTKLVADGSQALKDLSLLYNAYQKFIEEYSLVDTEERIRLAITDVTKANGIRKIEHLLVLGFTDFTLQQEVLLERISKLLTVTIIFDHSASGRKGVFFPQLKKGKAQEEILIPSKQKKNRSLLDYLQDELWTEKPALPPLNNDSTINLIKVKGGWRREILSIAQEIKKLLQSNFSLSPDQIGVITLYSSHWEEIYQIFEAFELPVATQIIKPLQGQPIARALLQPFKTVLTRFSWKEMIQFLRWGGIETEKELFSIVPTPNLADWRGELERIYSSQDQNLFKAKELLKILQEIPQEGKIKEYLQVCWQWIKHPLFLQSFLPCSGLSEPYLQERYFQTSLLGKIQGVIKEIEDSIFSFAEQQISLEEFLLILESVLGKEKIQHPTSWEQGIRLLTPENARGLSFKITFLSGLNEGVFPRINPEGWLIREKDVNQWTVDGFSLPRNIDQLAIERLLFCYLLNTARERLILSYCETDSEGQSLNPSSFLEDLLTLIPSLKSQAIEAGNKLVLPELSERKLGLKKEIKEKIALELIRGQGSSEVSGVLGIKEQEILEEKFSAHPISVSVLEEYASCPFRFFCRRILKIENLEEPEILPTRLEEGSIYHMVLKEFFHKYRGKVLCSKYLDNYLGEIRELVTSYYPVVDDWAPVIYRNFIALGREHLISQLEKVIKEEVEWAEKTNGCFTPKFLELGFGGVKKDADPRSIQSPLLIGEKVYGGKTFPLLIWGKIDRVDTDENGRFIIYDYKSGNPPPLKQINTGQLLQLPIYLLAVSRLFLSNKEPVGAAYYSLNKINRLRGLWRKEALDFGIKVRGALDQEEWEELITNSINKAFDYYFGMLQGDFSFCPQDQCPAYCEYRRICRRSLWGVAAN
jgi:ATP-dependent helicase/DNAse subunit B